MKTPSCGPCLRDIKELREFFIDFKSHEIPNETSRFSDWMGDLTDYEFEVDVKPFGSRTLQEIVLPGTHGAGAYELELKMGTTTKWDLNKIYDAAKQWDIEFGYIARAWLATQAHSIYDQLVFGIRYLDLRAIWNPEESEWRHVHVFYGGPFDISIFELARFLKEHPKEIVVVELQHILGGSPENRMALAKTIHDQLGAYLSPPGDGFQSSLEKMVTENKRCVFVLNDLESDALKRFPSFWSSSGIINTW
eukprot:368222_1